MGQLGQQLRKASMMAEGFLPACRQWEQKAVNPIRKKVLPRS